MLNQVQMIEEANQLHLQILQQQKAPEKTETAESPEGNNIKIIFNQHNLKLKNRQSFRIKLPKLIWAEILALNR